MHPIEIAAHWAWQTSLAASILVAPALLAAILLRKPVFTPVRHILGILVIGGAIASGGQLRSDCQ